MIPNLFCESSEKAFVGCIAESGGEILGLYPATPDHFTNFGCQCVFRVSDELFKAGDPVNSFTIRQKISESDLKNIGGEFALEEMCSFPSLSMAKYLFDTLEAKMALRRVFQISKWAEQEVQNTKDTALFLAEFNLKTASITSESESENLLGRSLDAIDARLDRIDRGEIETGYRTPLDVWDRAFGGILPGQMYALGGRPGTGKTAMMEMLIQNLLYQGAPVVVFEKDMSPEKLMARIACRGIGFPYWRYARGMVDRVASSKIREATAVLRKVPMYVYSPSGLTADRMCSIVRRDVRTKGVKAVFLDHIQALRVGELREGLTQASLAIRGCVTDTNVPHIILAHLNREGSKGRPSAENIKEFDQLYGDCDGMALLWSEKARADLEEGEMMEVNFFAAKNRDGDVTEDQVLFDGPTLTFKNKLRE